LTLLAYELNAHGDHGQVDRLNQLCDCECVAMCVDQWCQMRPKSRGRDRGQGQGPEAEAETKAKALRSRPRPRPISWGRGQRRG